MHSSALVEPVLRVVDRSVGHLTHVESAVAPAAEEYVPIGHCVQTSVPDCPVLLPDAAYLPGAQIEQIVCPARMV